MKKNDTDRPDADARAADADAAVRAWNTAEAEATSAATAHSPWVLQGAHMNPSVEYIRSKRRLLESKDAAALARVEATRAWDAFEVSKGDELATACDPQRAHDKLSLLPLGTEQPALTSLDTLRANMRASEAVAFIETLRRSVLALQARRVRAGLPQPTLAGKLSDSATREGAPANVLATLARIAANGPDAPESHTYEIAELLKKETGIFAARELAIREREQAELAARDAKEDREKVAAFEATNREKKWAEKDTQREQVAKERADLAAAYEARLRAAEAVLP